MRPGRRRSAPRAGRAGPAPPVPPGSPLLIRPRHAQVSGVRQVPAARAPALRVMVLGPVRDLPPHRRTRAARLLPRFRFLPARSAARRCFRGILRPGRSSADGGIEEFPLFRDPARSAAASCSRRPATIASSAAIRSACSPISTSRGSAEDPSGGGASVTARNIPETTLSHRGNTAPVAKTQPAIIHRGTGWGAPDLPDCGSL